MRSKSSDAEPVEAMADTASVPELSILAELLMGSPVNGNDNKRRSKETVVTQRQRKAIGIGLTLLTLVLWTALGLWIYELWLVGAHNFVHLAFFVLFGLAWVFPAMAVIRWMLRPDN